MLKLEMTCRAAIAMVALGVAASIAPAQSGSTPQALNIRPHHITVSVADLDRSVKWYEEKFGLTVQLRRKEKNLQIAWMKMPDFRIDLIQYNGSSKPPMPADHLLMQGWAHIVFGTDDVDREYRLLKERGANPSEPASNQAFKNRTFYVRDPDGNYIELYQDLK